MIKTKNNILTFTVILIAFILQSCGINTVFEQKIDCKF